MPIDRCGFSSWRDRKKSHGRGGTCGERGAEPPARLDAVPAAGSARRGAGVCVWVCGFAGVRVWVRGCERRAALTGAPRTRVRRAGRLCRGSHPPARRGGCAAPAAPLTPPRPSPALPLLRSSGFSTQFSLPSIPAAAVQQKLSLYQDSSNTSQGKPDVK